MCRACADIFVASVPKASLFCVFSSTPEWYENGERVKSPSPPRQKFIVVATPTLGMVSIEWAAVFRNLMWPMNTGYSHAFVRDVAGNEIAETRNAAVSIAMRYENEYREVSHIFWIDDDVLIQPRALLRLLSHQRDIASGCYFLKCDPTEPLIFPGKGAGTTPFIPNQTFETWGHGMGVCLVRMEVYKRTRDELELPPDKYGNPTWYKTTHAENAVVENGSLYVGGTEDLYFLDAAWKIGYRPLMDTSADAFGFHFDSRNRQGYPIKQWNQFQSGQPIEWETPDGIVRWGPARKIEPVVGDAVEITPADNWKQAAMKQLVEA
jgi:hypothetical protein